MYVKLFPSMLDGTLHGNPDGITTMILLLMLADPEGFVDMTPQAIAARTSFPLDVIQRGIEYLSQPDPGSRTHECDGRRIELVDPDVRPWGWHIVNYLKYRNLKDPVEKRRADRERIAAKRKAVKPNGGAGVAGNTTKSDTKRQKRQKRQVAKVAQAEAEADTEADTGDISVASQPHSGKPEKLAKEIEIVFDHWKVVHRHPRSKLDTKRRTVIRKALGDYDEAALCQSISGYLNSPHHMGQNEKSTKYDDIEVMLRDAKHIDAGLKFYEQPPNTDLSSLSRGNVDRTAEWIPEEMRNGTG